jgi:hypothetical protein
VIGIKNNKCHTQCALLYVTADLYNTPYYMAQLICTIHLTIWHSWSVQYTLLYVTADLYNVPYYMSQLICTIHLTIWHSWSVLTKVWLHDLEIVNFDKNIYILVKKGNVTPLSIFIAFLIQTISLAGIITRLKSHRTFVGWAWKTRP